MFAPLTIRLFVDPCFFEGGCDRGEGTMLLLAGVVTLALMIVAGLVVRLIVNRLLAAR